MGHTGTGPIGSSNSPFQFKMDPVIPEVNEVIGRLVKELELIQTQWIVRHRLMVSTEHAMRSVEILCEKLQLQVIQQEQHIKEMTAQLLRLEVERRTKP